MDETETTLGVWKVVAGASRKFLAHPAIGPSSQRRHRLRLGHPVANDQQSAGLSDTLQQRGEVRRVVLAVTIERHAPFKAQLKQFRESGLKRRAFAAVASVAEDQSAGVFGFQRGLIVRAVIHHSY